jgi:Glutathione S-transferase, C-terminal domain
LVTFSNKLLQVIDILVVCRPLTKIPSTFLRNIRGDRINHYSNSVIATSIIDYYPLLTPAKPLLQEKMKGWINLQNQFPMRELMYGNYRGIEGVVLRRSVQIKQKLLPQLIQENPELKEHYEAKLNDVRQWNSSIQDVNEIATINARMEPMLAQLEEQLSQTDWLCGTTYSLADAVWTAVLNRLGELKFDLWADNTRPALKAYLSHLKARPSFKIAIQDDKVPLPMLLAGLRRIFLSIW